jgi:hypothetical protein
MRDADTSAAGLARLPVARNALEAATELEAPPGNVTPIKAPGS